MIKLEHPARLVNTSHKLDGTIKPTSKGLVGFTAYVCALVHLSKGHTISTSRHAYVIYSPDWVSPNSVPLHHWGISTSPATLTSVELNEVDKVYALCRKKCCPSTTVCNERATLSGPVTLTQLSSSDNSSPLASCQALKTLLRNLPTSQKKRQALICSVNLPN